MGPPVGLQDSDETSAELMLKVLNNRWTKSIKDSGHGLAGAAMLGSCGLTAPSRLSPRTQAVTGRGKQLQGDGHVSGKLKLRVCARA